MATFDVHAYVPVKFRQHGSLIIISMKEVGSTYTLRT